MSESHEPPRDALRRPASYSKYILPMLGRSVILTLSHVCPRHLSKALSKASVPGMRTRLLSVRALMWDDLP